MIARRTRDSRYPVAVGTIVYIQDHRDPHGIVPDRLRYRNPWIVEAWHPREYTAARKVCGRYVNTYMRGGHLATVRSLRDGRRKRCADWLLKASLGQ